MKNKVKKGDEARIVWGDNPLSGARRFKNGEIVVIDGVNTEDGYMFCLTKSGSRGHWVGINELELVTKDEDAEKQMREYSDAVQNPSHYTSGEIECIDAIKASMTPEAFKGFLKGNVQKYMWRYEKKQNPVQDLEKAQWYLSKLIELENKGAE